MSNLKDSIKKMLVEREENNRKVVTINIEEELLIKTDKVAKHFSKINEDKNFSRNYIIEMAIKAFIKESGNILLENYNIDINQDEDSEVIEDDERINDYYDLVIFPAHDEGFNNNVFITEKQWYAVRIREDRIPKIKYIAIYRGAPTSGITHYGKVKEIKQYENTNKKIIYLDDEPIELNHTIKLGDTDANSMRSPRYTTVTKLLSANVIKDLF